MTDHARRPLLFLDVDGPLLPFGEAPNSEKRSPHPTRLTSEMGRRLAALPCDLVWATTWEEKANTEIASQLGLPHLPVVNWPAPSKEHEHEDRWFGLSWKTRTLVAWASGRPFAWVDDEITEADQTWATAHHTAPALLHHVKPYTGLEPKDFTLLNHWLQTP